MLKKELPSRINISFDLQDFTKATCGLEDDLRWRERDRQMKNYAQGHRKRWQTKGGIFIVLNTPSIFIYGTAIHHISAS